MSDIIRFILLFALIAVAVKLTYFIYKRCLMLTRIFSLKKLCNANITLHRFPFLPMWIRSDKPDISVEILDTVYHIRLYSGISATRYVHFTDAEYSVVYKNVRTMVTPARAAAKSPSNVKLSYSAGGKVRIIGDMKLPDVKGKTSVKVLLFSPAPHEVSYVTEERSTIRLAFTGDELYGYKIFTPSTFVTYADREKRTREQQMPKILQ